jgi:hypothetical protein
MALLGNAEIPLVPSQLVVLFLLYFNNNNDCTCAGGQGIFFQTCAFIDGSGEFEEYKGDVTEREREREREREITTLLLSNHTLLPF